LHRSLIVWTSSSSSCGLSLGPGDGYLLGGSSLIGELLLPPVLLADPPLYGEVFFNGEVFPLPAVLLADEALGGDPPTDGDGKALLTNSANSV